MRRIPTNLLIKNNPINLIKMAVWEPVISPKDVQEFDQRLRAKIILKSNHGKKNKSINTLIFSGVGGTMETVHVINIRPCPFERWMG